MGSMLLERLSDVTRQFDDVLIIGARCPDLVNGLAAVTATAKARVTIIEPSPGLAQSQGAIQGDEDHLPVDPESFDCIIWPGGMESVNDVPTALLRCRLALKGDGLLLGCFPGDGSFPMLRRILNEDQGDRIIARMQPQIDTRSMGDLLTKIGLTMAVADTERLILSYQSLGDLVGDLRAAAWTNMLQGAIHPFGRHQHALVSSAFDRLRDESGRCREEVRIVHFSGWAPHASQPAPARRGSASMSLAEALKSPRAG